VTIDFETVSFKGYSYPRDANDLVSKWAAPLHGYYSALVHDDMFNMTADNSNGASPDAQEAENVGHLDEAEGSVLDETTRSQGFKSNLVTSTIAGEPHHCKFLQPAYSHLPLHL